MGGFLRFPGAVVPVVVATSLFTPNLASAHGLTILCRQADGGVEVRVGYGRTAATPAPSTYVRVTDATGAVVAEGVTDAAGVWRMPTPPAGEYRVAADDDDHASSVRLTIAPPAGGLPTAGVSTAPAARERPSVWPVVVVFAAVAVIVGYWRYRTRRSAPPSSQPPPEAP